MANQEKKGETDVKHYAEQLSDVMMRMEDLRVEAGAIIEAAKDAGVNVRALRKVAKELITDAGKLAKLYDDEDQLDMFRAEVGIRKRKGLKLEAAE